MLPPFNERCDLPPGVHAASWDELTERFGAGEVRQMRLRTLRQLHKELRDTDRCAGEAVNAALHAIRSMDITHLEFVDEADEVVH